MMPPPHLTRASTDAYKRRPQLSVYEAEDDDDDSDERWPPMKPRGRYSERARPRQPLRKPREPTPESTPPSESEEESDSEEEDDDDEEEDDDDDEDMRETLGTLRALTEAVFHHPRLRRTSATGALRPPPPFPGANGSAGTDSVFPTGSNSFSTGLRRRNAIRRAHPYPPRVITALRDGPTDNNGDTNDDDDDSPTTRLGMLAAQERSMRPNRSNSPSQFGNTLHRYLEQVGSSNRDGWTTFIHLPSFVVSSESESESEAEAAQQSGADEEEAEEEAESIEGGEAAAREQEAQEEVPTGRQRRLIPTVLSGSASEVEEGTGTRIMSLNEVRMQQESRRNQHQQQRQCSAGDGRHRRCIGRHGWGRVGPGASGA